MLQQRRIRFGLAVASCHLQVKPEAGIGQMAYALQCFADCVGDRPLEIAELAAAKTMVSTLASFVAKVRRKPPFGAIRIVRALLNLLWKLLSKRFGHHSVTLHERDAVASKISSRSIRFCC